jgi:hypothetical protein
VVASKQSFFMNVEENSWNRFMLPFCLKESVHNIDENPLRILANCSRIIKPAELSFKMNCDYFFFFIAFHSSD